MQESVEQFQAYASERAAVRALGTKLWDKDAAAMKLAQSAGVRLQLPDGGRAGHALAQFEAQVESLLAFGYLEEVDGRVRVASEEKRKAVREQGDAPPSPFAPGWNKTGVTESGKSGWNTLVIDEYGRGVEMPYLAPETIAEQRRISAWHRAAQLAKFSEELGIDLTSLPPSRATVPADETPEPAEPPKGDWGTKQGWARMGPKR